MMKLRLFLVLLIMLSAVSAAASESADRLADVMGGQPEEVQARYAARRPLATLGFFGIEPGMTVVEGLPGEGWYSKILLPYLGKQGKLIGADYAADMYSLFGFFPQDFIDSRSTWVADWTAEASGWSSTDGATVAAFQFGSLPEGMHGTADAVLMIRAMHNLARFESKGDYLSKAIEDIFNVLKPGGVLGVVQHMAREDMSDKWASGRRGYLKESFIIERLEKAGFVHEETSDINHNPMDQPGPDDVVWRLPPSLQGAEEGTAARARVLEIGESNRTTMRFRKPE
jgi:predicted methyltransferase